MRRISLISLILFSILVAAGFSFWRLGGNEIFSNFNLASVFPGSEVEKERRPDAPESGDKPKYEFNLPQGYKAVATKEEGFEITTYEKSAREGFQVSIMPFDEPGPLTPERILLDLDIDVKNPQYISVAGLQALAFEKKDPDLGKTFEVWFVHEEKLYQVMTYREFAEELTEILSTWRFR